MTSSDVSEQKPPLAAALRHLAERERRSLTEHPTAPELASYHAGELPPEAEARLREHLALCRNCTDLLLDLAGFADLKPPQGVPELTDEEVEQDWQALRERMREEPAEEKRPAEVVPIRPVGPPKRERDYPLWMPIAASLLAVLGFAFGLYQNSRVAVLEKQLDEQRQPWSASWVPLLDAKVRSAEEEEVRQVTSSKGAVLSLYSEAEEIYPAYEAEIVGRAKVKLAPPDEVDRAVSLIIPPDYLKPGSYQILLYGMKDDRRVELGRYQIQVDGP